VDDDDDDDDDHIATHLSLKLCQLWTKDCRHRPPGNPTSAIMSLPQHTKQTKTPGSPPKGKIRSHEFPPDLLKPLPSASAVRIPRRPSQPCSRQQGVRVNSQEAVHRRSGLDGGVRERGQAGGRALVADAPRGHAAIAPRLAQHLHTTGRHPTLSELHSEWLLLCFGRFPPNSLPSQQ
jgi:hypothetical protein